LVKKIFEVGYIRHRKTGISDYTIVDSREVLKILQLLKPYVILKKKQVELGIKILELKNSGFDFIEICKLVDNFKKLNYSKKRKITSDFVNKSLSP
jgi:hypothetical protein